MEDGRAGTVEDRAGGAVRAPRQPGATEAALVKRLSGLHTALVCDVLDQLGHRNAFLGFQIASVCPPGVVVGAAFTMAAAAVDGPPDEPYRELLGAYDHMSGGDVVVIGTGSEHRSGIWGELLTVAAQARGVCGAVTDGLVRDVEQTERLEFPVFASGVSPLDSKGRLEVYEYGGAVTCGDAVVGCGDLILGDRMGVVAVPREAVEDVLDLAEEKKRSESAVRKELAQGVGVADVFSRHRVL